MGSIMALPIGILGFNEVRILENNLNFFSIFLIAAFPS
jgi:hypothetical protein